MSDNQFVIEVTAENFQQTVVEQSLKTPVLLDFWAPWCNPCKTLSPILDRVATTLNGAVIIGKINTEVEQELGAHFQIRSIPTMMLVKEGAIVDTLSGALPESGILEFLNKNGVVNEKDALLQSAKQAIDAEDWPQASETLMQAMNKFPEDTQIKLELARLLVRLQNLDGAKEVLSTVAPGDQNSAEFKALQASLTFGESSASDAEIEELQAKDDLDSKFKLGQIYLGKGDYKQALDNLLAVIAINKEYADGEVRKTYLDTLAVLGDADPLAIEYRRKLFTYLY